MAIYPLLLVPVHGPRQDGPLGEKRLGPRLNVNLLEFCIGLPAI